MKHTRVADLTVSEKRRLNVACHLQLDTDIVILDQVTIILRPFVHRSYDLYVRYLTVNTAP